MERGGYLELNAVVDSSDIEGADAHGVPNPSIDQSPVIGQMKSDIRSLIRPGTPTMVSSMEDPASKRRFQLDVTATKDELKSKDERAVQGLIDQPFLDTLGQFARPLEYLSEHRPRQLAGLRVLI